MAVLPLYRQVQPQQNVVCTSDASAFVAEDGRLGGCSAGKDGSNGTGRSIGTGGSSSTSGCSGVHS